MHTNSPADALAVANRHASRVLIGRDFDVDWRAGPTGDAGIPLLRSGICEIDIDFARYMDFIAARIGDVAGTDTHAPRTPLRRMRPHVAAAHHAPATESAVMAPPVLNEE